MVTDFQEGALTLVLLVLAILADGAELENLVALTNLGRPLDDHMRTDPAPLADLNLGADQSPGSNHHVGADHSTRVDDGRVMNYRTWMDHDVSSRVWHTSAQRCKPPRHRRSRRQ